MTDSLTRARALLCAHPIFDGHNDLPWALRTAVSYDLLDRGWSDADIAKLTSGNILRVLRVAQDLADDLASRGAVPG